MADLKGRSVRGAAVTLTAQAIRFVLHTASTMVLARLLTPADFGLVAMATAVTGFVAMFKDAGLSMATVQRPEITHAQVSTLFWINVLLSVAVMGVVAALAPAIAWFYNEPRLVGITLVLAGTFIFGGLTVQHQALLRRQMRFRALAIIDIASMAVGIATAIVAGAYGFGYWALVGMTVATAAANCLLVWRASHWRPGPPRNAEGLLAMISFGGYLTASSLLNYLRAYSPSILLGIANGPTAVGLFEKAHQLLLAPLTQGLAPVGSVAIPMLSRLHRDTVRLRRACVHLLLFAQLVVVPLSAALFFLAPQAIRFLLGDQWLDAIPLLRILSLLAPTQAYSTVAIWLLIASGQGRALFVFSVLNAALAAGSVAFALPFGVPAVAACFAGVGLTIRTPLLFVFAIRHTALAARDVVAAVLIPSVAAFAIGALVSLVTLYPSAPADTTRALATTGCFVVVWALLLFWRARDSIVALVSMFVPAKEM